MRNNLDGADQMALAMRGGAVGANLGFRRAWNLSSPAELAAIRVGEDEVLRRARRFNGMDPAFRNGFGPGHSRRQCQRIIRLPAGAGAVQESRQELLAAGFSAAAADVYLAACVR